MPVPSWFARQAAAIPYRMGDRGPEFLLVTTRKRGRWIVPKGVIEPGQTAREAAAREAFEEAGVVGVVEGRAVGRYSYRKWSRTCRVEVFLLRVDRLEKAWPEREERRRAWMPAEEAIARVTRQGVPELLRKAADRLGAAGAGTTADGETPASDSSPGNRKKMR